MWWTLLFSFFSGSLLTAAFSPFNIYSLGFISPAILLFLWLQATPRKSFLIGWLFGLGFFGTGTSWIFISIHHFGAMPTLLASLITFIFFAILALYFALFGFIFRKYFSHLSHVKICLLVFPALWVFFEYLRSTLLTGFSWLLLGYTQLTTPLQGLAPLVGVYGLSLVTSLIAGALVLLATKQTRLIKITAWVLIFAWIGLGWLFENHAWTTPIGSPIKTSLIQGNIAQQIKWSIPYVQKTAGTYENLTLQNLSSQLIIWPECALPIYENHAKAFIRQLNAIIKKNHSNLIFGLPIDDRKTQKYYNGLLLIGDNQGEYLKRHLVPFGEYTPFEKIFKKTKGYFKISMSGFSKGPKHQPDLKVNNIRIAPFICYEIAFPTAVLNAAENSELLLTMSDDAWFGKSIELSQHLQIAQMRSLETGRPQLLSANTGITAFISPFGKVLQGAPINQRIAITEDVQPMTGKTPLMRWHYYPITGVVILMLLCAVLI